MNRRLSWWLNLVFQVITTYFFWTTAAHADPISSAIITAFKLVGLAATLVKAAVFVAAVVAVNALAKVSAKPKTSAGSGIKQTTSTGGITSRTAILGEYATGGQLVAPPNSYGNDGETPNAYLTYVITYGGIRGHTLNKLIINDDYVTIGDTLENIGGSTVQGYPIQGIYAGNAWIRYYDGTQTIVDPLLIAKFAGDANRPWTVNMTGIGVCYAVIVFKYNTDIFSNFPTVRFQVGGIPLYDPRKDDTVSGGAGSHRWGDISTYQQTKNPIIALYNIHRGITTEDGQVWGGECEAEDLPVDNWFTAMNECDVLIEKDDGTFEKQFEFGVEFSFDEEPADVMEEIEKACLAQQVEFGGVWTVRCGPPALPVVTMTDDDILIDHDQDHDLFTSIDDANNAITGSYTEPTALWNSKDAPSRSNATWQAEDGRPISEDVSLPLVFSVTQAQRIMDAALNEDRRFRRHNHTLPPYFNALQTLDSVAWTSEREGYTSKQFEITSTVEGFFTLNVTTALRERDSSDYDWDTGLELPTVISSPGTTFPVVQSVPDWTVIGTSIKDEAGNDRKPAIQLSWNGAGLYDVRGIMYEIRLKDAVTTLGTGYAPNVAVGGVVISAGVLPATNYQVRGQLDVDRPTEWTLWTDVLTPDTRLSEFDLPPGFVDTVNQSALDVIRLYALGATYKQITDSLLYTGDGKSVQLTATQALTKSTTAINTLNFIGAMLPDNSAYVLNAAYVQIDPEGTTLAGFANSTTTTVGEHTASIEEFATSIDGLRANYQLKVQAGKYIAGVYANADDTTGTSEVGFFATKFFIADVSDPDNPIQVFGYSGGLFSLHSNVQIDGSLNIINGTITTDGIAIGALTNGDIVTNTAYQTIDVSSTPTVLTYDITTHEGGSVELIATCNFDALHGSYFYMQFWRDSDMLHQIPEVQMLNVRQNYCVPFKDATPPAGAHTYTIRFAIQSGADTSIGFLYRSLKVQEFKR